MYKLVKRYDWLEWRAIWVIDLSRGPGGVFGVRLTACRGRERDLTHISRRQSAPWLHGREGRSQGGGELWKLLSLFLRWVLHVRDVLTLLWGRGGAGGGRWGGGKAGVGGECIGTKLPVFCWRRVGLRARYFKLQGGNWDRNGNKWQTEGEKIDSDENQKKTNWNSLKKKRKKETMCKRKQNYEQRCGPCCVKHVLCLSWQTETWWVCVWNYGICWSELDWYMGKHEQEAWTDRVREKA